MRVLVALALVGGLWASRAVAQTADSPGSADVELTEGYAADTADSPAPTQVVSSTSRHRSVQLGREVGVAWMVGGMGVLGAVDEDAAWPALLVGLPFAGAAAGNRWPSDMSPGQINAVRAIHGVGTIAVGRLYYAGAATSCMGDIACGQGATEQPLAYLLASSVTLGIGSLWAHAHPELDELEGLRYLHATYWSVLAGGPIISATTEGGDAYAGAVVAWTLGGIMLGDYLNQHDLWDARQLRTMTHSIALGLAGGLVTFMVAGAFYDDQVPGAPWILVGTETLGIAAGLWRVSRSTRD